MRIIKILLIIALAIIATGELEMGTYWWAQFLAMGGLVAIIVIALRKEKRFVK